MDPGFGKKSPELLPCGRAASPSIDIDVSRLDLRSTRPWIDRLLPNFEKWILYYICPDRHHRRVDLDSTSTVRFTNNIIKSNFTGI